MRYQFTFIGTVDDCAEGSKQAEYLPLPTIPTTDGTSELLSNLLLSILPNVPNASAVAVTVPDSQWEEVLWNRTDDEDTEEELNGKPKANSHGADAEDDIYAYEDEEDANADVKRKGDWVGVDRDRRSAFLIIGALKSEGIL